MSYTWRWQDIYQQTRPSCHLEDSFHDEETVESFFANLVHTEKEFKLALKNVNFDLVTSKLSPCNME